MHFSMFLGLAMSPGRSWNWWTQVELGNPRVQDLIPRRDRSTRKLGSGDPHTSDSGNPPISFQPAWDIPQKMEAPNTGSNRLASGGPSPFQSTVSIKDWWGPLNR